MNGSSLGKGYYSYAENVTKTNANFAQRCTAASTDLIPLGGSEHGEGDWLQP